MLAYSPCWPCFPLPLRAQTRSSIGQWVRSQGGAVDKDSSGKVVGIDLSSTWVTDADTARLGRLSGLRKLDLSHTKITDVGLEHLRGLNQVVDLNLYFAEYITDSGIAHIKGWTQLKHLNLRGTKVTSRVFDHLQGLENLRSLDLSSTEITDAGFENLASLPHLETLAIGGNRVLGPGLSLLKLLPALKHLDVGGIQRVDSGLWGIALNDSNMQKIGELTRLETLKLNGANLSDRGLDRPGHELARRKELTSLPNLKGLVNLRALELNRTPLTRPALDALRELPPVKAPQRGVCHWRRRSGRRGVSIARANGKPATLGNGGDRQRASPTRRPRTPQGIARRRDRRDTGSGREVPRESARLHRKLVA